MGQTMDFGSKATPLSPLSASTESRTGRLECNLGQMDGLLAQLKACRPETWETRKNLPNRGVYAFYEGCKPLYVGAQTRYGRGF